MSEASHQIALARPAKGWRGGVLRGLRGADDLSLPVAGLVVLKVGGSLLSRPDWPALFASLMAACGSRSCCLVVGGGAVVDGLRVLDRAVPQSPQFMHDLAIDAMRLTARLVAAAMSLPLAATPPDDGGCRAWRQPPARQERAAPPLPRRRRSPRDAGSSRLGGRPFSCGSAATRHDRVGRTGSLVTSLTPAAVRGCPCPSRMFPSPIKAPGGSRGTPGLNAVQRAMHFREEPNDPVSPDFRPGLFVKRSPAAGQDARLRPYAGRQDGGLNASGRSPPRKNGLDGHVFREASPTTSRLRDVRPVPACVMP